MVTKGIELLPLKNGVLNLATNQLRPYNDDDYFTFQLPTGYDLHAQHGRILFLKPQAQRSHGHTGELKYDSF
ncbi:MAG: hypothetical protein QXV17_09750 [Candidatus Micrarchaeaceae archaeon]